ncbi:MAG TPA: PKD domain-containing protein [Verrucomicrobiae bacterium]|nr:PKD domain-containing protein [Verrucomicrobiae bacterium]
MVYVRGLARVFTLGFFLTVTLLTARAVTVVSETGRDARGWAARTDEFGIVSWSQTNGYQDVEITVRLYSVAAADKGTAYLMRRVGPGTTTADQVAVASVTFPMAYPADVLIFSGLTLGPGTYYLIVAGGSNYWSAWFGTDQPTIATDAGVTHNGNVYVFEPVAYPPAAVPHDHPEMHYIFSVTGNRIGENRPPIANAGGDQYLECYGIERRVLDGRASYDPDGEPLTFTWWQGETQIGTGPTLSVDLQSGQYGFRLVVTDTAGASAEDTVWIVIEDTTPPLMETSVSLSPAKGKMVSAVIEAEVRDVCDPLAAARIIAVESDEASGRLADWEITGALSLNLRTRGLGRIKARAYYVTVEASDASGNTSRRTVPILLP